LDLQQVSIEASFYHNGTLFLFMKSMSHAVYQQFREDQCIYPRIGIKFQFMIAFNSEVDDLIFEFRQKTKKNIIEVFPKCKRAVVL
jgi:hypothetical protein